MPDYTLNPMAMDDSFARRLQEGTPTDWEVIARLRLEIARLRIALQEVLQLGGENDLIDAQWIAREALANEQTPRPKEVKK